MGAIAAHPRVPDLCVARLSAITKGRRAQAVGYTALRTRSPRVREAIVRAATGDRHDEATLAAYVRDTGEFPAVMFDTSTLPASFALAMVWATLGDSDEQAHRAGDLYRGLLDVVGPGGFGEEASFLYGQLSFILGREDEARRLLAESETVPPIVRTSLEADLANPYVHGRTPEPSSHRAWEERLALLFTPQGVEPPTIADTSAHLFDGLGAQRGPAVDGPLVSVVMPCFRPDEGLDTSVRSIVGQTYENLEILLVDDCSGPDYAERFERCTAMDPRVRLLTLPVNGGSYVARNAAIDEASGDFITTQDADDWSHPDRIAHQVELFRRGRDVPATRSGALRALDDMTTQWLGFLPERPNASSLMVRRSTIERVGVFDSVRKSADAEYSARITRVLGPVEDTGTPLAVTRLRGGTLSRGDYAFQWQNPDRALYHKTYKTWHESPDPAREPVGPDHARNRRFAAPRSLTRRVPGAPKPRDTVDVLYVADVAQPGLFGARVPGGPDLFSPESVGLLPGEDAGRARRGRPGHHRDVIALVNEGRLDAVTENDEITAGLVVVLTPEILELRSIHPVHLTPGRVLVVVRPPGQDHQPNDLLAVIDGCVETFGMRPQFVALTPADQALWHESGMDLQLLGELLPRGASEDRGQLASVSDA